MSKRPKYLSATCGTITLQLLPATQAKIVHAHGKRWKLYAIISVGSFAEFPSEISLHRLAKKHLGRAYMTCTDGRQLKSSKLFCYLETGTTPEGRAAFLGAVSVYTERLTTRVG